MRIHMPSVVGLCILALTSAAIVASQVTIASSTARQETNSLDTSTSGTYVLLQISGGHDTDQRDRGRPVALIAGALGVTPEVFRHAFSAVRPAAGGREPAPEQVRQNKDALMKVLGPLGISNDRLDEVSNYYRYNRGRGEMWPTQPAVAYGILSNGTITGFHISNRGSGYNSAPTVTCPSKPSLKIQATLAWNSKFQQNGSLQSLKLIKGQPTPN